MRKLSILIGLATLIWACQVPNQPKDTNPPSDSTPLPQDATLFGTYDAWTYAGASGWLKIAGNQFVLEAAKLSMAGTTLFPASGLSNQRLGIKDGQIWMTGSGQTLYLYDYFLQVATETAPAILWLKTDPTATASLTAAPDPASALTSQILCFVAVGKTPQSATNASAVSAPTFSPEAGSKTEAIAVTISSTTDGASIRYTLDGTTPSAVAGTLYTKALTIGSTTTVKAVAYKTGLSTSAVSTAVYTFADEGGPSGEVGEYRRDPDFLASFQSTLAIDGNGTIYSSRYGGSIGVSDALGNSLPAITPVAEMSGLNDLAIDKNGNLYTFDGWYFVTILKPDGGVVRQFGGAKYQGQTAIVKVGISLAVDATSNIFVADSESNSIYKFSSAGTLLKTFGGTGVANGKLHLTTGGKTLALDSTGNLFVLDSGNNRISKFDNNGNFLATIPIAGGNQVLIDSSDRLYTFDGTNLRELDGAGTVVSTFATDRSGLGTFDTKGNLYVGSGSVLYRYNRVTPITIPAATAIALTPSAVTLIAGEQESVLSMQTTPSRAVATVTWTSSHPEVATVGSSGVVKPLSAGTTTITASTQGGLLAKATVTVAPIPTPTFTPAGGVQAESSVKVTLQCSLAGTTIRYTINGTDPTATAGNIYYADSGITLYSTTTIRAITIYNGITSPVASATFTLPSSAVVIPQPATPSNYGVSITPSSATIARSSPVATFSNYGYSGTAQGYQWYIDGEPIAGATSSVLNLDVTNPFVSGGKHQLTLVIADQSGVSYSGTASFTVTN